MTRFTAWFAVAALVAAVVGIAIMVTSPVDAEAEVGKWLLSLSTALAVTGALGTLVKAAEERRAARAEWGSLLHDVTEAADTVRVARLLINAHQSAAAYRDQLKELSRARTVLRRVRHEQAVSEQEGLLAAIKQMVNYLDGLGQEYQENYLRASRLQRVDEERLKALSRRLSTSDKVDLEATELVGPSQSWELLGNARYFPRLVKFLSQEEFEGSDFQRGYDNSKAIIQRLANGEK